VFEFYCAGAVVAKTTMPGSMTYSNSSRHFDVLQLFSGVFFVHTRIVIISIFSPASVVAIILIDVIESFGDFSTLANYFTVPVQKEQVSGTSLHMQSGIMSVSENSFVVHIYSKQHECPQSVEILAI